MSNASRAAHRWNGASSPTKCTESNDSTDLRGRREAGSVPYTDGSWWRCSHSYGQCRPAADKSWTHRRRPSTRSGVPRSPTSSKADRSPCHQKQNLTSEPLGSQLTGLDRGGQRERRTARADAHRVSAARRKVGDGGERPSGWLGFRTGAARESYMRRRWRGSAGRTWASRRSPVRTGLSFVATSTAASVRRRQIYRSGGVWRHVSWLDAYRVFGVVPVPHRLFAARRRRPLSSVRLRIGEACEHLILCIRSSELTTCELSLLSLVAALICQKMSRVLFSSKNFW